MSNPLKTINKRIQTYGKDILVEKNKKLYCRLCNVELNPNRKSTIDQHLKTNMHISLAEKSKLKSSLNLNDSYSPNIRENTCKSEISYDIIQAFAIADIPFEKLDNLEFRNCFNKYFNQEHIIPSSRSISKQLQDVFNQRSKEIKESLKNKKIAIITDESIDIYDKYFIQVIAVELNSNSKSTTFLLDTVYLEQTNFRTVSLGLVKVLNKYDIGYENILAFVSDNNSYTHKAYDQVLSNLFPNSRHVNCTARIIERVADTWRLLLKDLDSFLSEVTFVFSKSPARRIRYLDFLKEKGVENYAFPPSSDTTKFETWFEAVLNHQKCFNHLSQFFDQEIANSSDTERLKDLTTSLKNPQLKQDIDLICEHCPKFMLLLKKYQNSHVYSFEIFNDLTDLFNWHEINLNAFRNQEKKVKIFNASKAILNIYINQNGMSSLSLFKALRFLNPNVYRALSKDINDYIKDIPELSICTDEWQIFNNIIKETNFEAEINVGRFWKSVKKSLPKLYRLMDSLIYLPSNSIECQNSISVYNNNLTNNKSLNRESIVMLNFIKFNKIKILNISENEALYACSNNSYEHNISNNDDTNYSNENFDTIDDDNEDSLVDDDDDDNDDDNNNLFSNLVEVLE